MIFYILSFFVFYDKIFIIKTNNSIIIFITSKGIFADCNDNINHSITVIGFTDDYWIVKNSWAKSWGEDGYIRLKMGNTCGICTYGITARFF